MSQDSIHRPQLLTEGKGEPKRIRTEDPLLTRLSNAIPLSQTGPQARTVVKDGIESRLVEPRRSSSGGVWKSRWPSWAPVPNKPTVSVDVKQHSTNKSESLELSSCVWKWRWPSWAPVPNKPTVSVDVKQHFKPWRRFGDFQCGSLKLWLRETHPE